MKSSPDLNLPGGRAPTCTTIALGRSASRHVASPAGFRDTSNATSKPAARWISCASGSAPRPTLIGTSAPTRRASASGSSRTPAWRWRFDAPSHPVPLPPLRGSSTPIATAASGHPSSRAPATGAGLQAASYLSMSKLGGRCLAAEPCRQANRGRPDPSARGLSYCARDPLPATTP
jgi:hypothetical protein